MFTKLPDKKLWLVIEMCVVKLEVAEDLGKIYYYYIARRYQYDNINRPYFMLINRIASIAGRIIFIPTFASG